MEASRGEGRTSTCHVDYKFPQALPLSLAQVLKDVTVVLVEELEAHGQVVVLQNGLIIVHEGQLGVWGKQRTARAWGGQTSLFPLQTRSNI